MQIVSVFDPSAAAAGTFKAQASSGTYKMVVMNESNVNLIFTFANGDTTQVPAWQSRLYCRHDGNSDVKWAQQTVLVASGAPVSQVIVETFAQHEEIIEGYPAPLVRQTNVGNMVTTVGGGSSFVQNDSNAAGTSIVESTVLGDSGSAVSLTNDGVLTIGTAAHPGHVSLDHAKITSDGSGNLTIQELIAVAAGLGLSVTGSISTDGGKITSDGAGALTVLDLITTILKINPAVTTLVGGTNGTADCLQPLQGTVKLVIILCNQFRTGGADQDYTLPVAFTTKGFYWTGNVDTGHFVNGGAGQNVDQATAFGTLTNQGNFTTGSFGDITHPFDTIRFNSGAGSNHNGMLVVLGV